MRKARSKEWSWVHLEYAFHGGARPGSGADRPRLPELKSRIGFKSLTSCFFRVQRWADGSQTCVAGCCEVDAIGAAEVAAAACRTAQSAATCVPCVLRASVQKIGREGAAAMASRLAGRVGLVEVLWCHSHQSPSRRPEQR
jgi:hypothetical protein